MTYGIRLALAGLTLVLVADSAHAQTDDDLLGEARCKVAGQIIAHVPQGKLLEHAYAVMGRCPNAAATFADAWTHPITDSVTLSLLARKSADLADRRILNVTLPLVQNARTPAPVRRAALDVVLAQYAPDVAMGSGGWADPDHSTLAAVSDYYQRAGEQPPTAADRLHILDVFRQLSASDPDLHWRQVAKRVAESLPYHH